MINKITELTPEQTADLATTREKWLSIGLSTETIDREAAKVAVSHAYECVGLTPPKVFIFLDSPQQGAIAAALLKGSKFGAQVWDQVGAQVRAQVRDQVEAAIYGSHDAGWLGFYEFFNRHFALAEKATCLFEVSRTCGWVWTFTGCAIITDRPLSLSFDDRKLLHSETGPAIAYRDGFAVHAWHGVRIPAEWIEDKASLTPKVALTWENIEQRRVAMQIVGWANVLRELGARVIDDHADPETGTLVEVDLPGEDDEKIRARFLHVLCGTKREFALGVPPDTASAEAAQAWLFGETTYQKPEVRT